MQELCPFSNLVHRLSFVRDLELICNSKTGSQKQSLFGMINHTKTDVGARYAVELALDVMETV